MLDTVAVDSGQIEIIDPVMRSGDSVIFQSGLGDGLYEVWVREIMIGTLDGTPDTDEDWRIAEVRLTLIDDEDLARWNDD